MSKHDRSTRGREYRDRSHDRYDRSDRYEKSDRDRDTTRRSRRHRSPSYDSYSDSESDDYSSDSSREPSPRRPSRRHTTAYSDGEDRSHGHHKSRGREHRRREREYYSEESPSRERKGKAGLVEDLLAAVGLIQSKNKDRGHDRRDRSEGPPEEKKKQTREALQAALAAAAMEAFRTRKEGKLTPQRLMQIAGAAIAAGGLDVIVDRSGGDGGGLKTIIESVVAGLATGKTMGKNIKHKRDDDTMGNKVGTGVVGMAAKHLARSLSQGPRRSRTTKY